MKQGWQIQEEAFCAFEAWLSRQSEDVQELSILEQIDLYADNEAERAAA